MSVIKRYRSLSDLEFFRVLCQIDKRLTQFLMNEKNVPKRSRFIYSNPIINCLTDCYENIVVANSIYPYDEHELALRMHYQVLAYADIEKILMHLNRLINNTDIDASKLTEPVNMLVKEASLLRGWRRGSKGIYKKIAKRQKEKEEGQVNEDDQQTDESQADEAHGDDDNSDKKYTEVMSEQLKELLLESITLLD